MGRKRKTLFGESAIKNAQEYGSYLERLTELSVSMFEWKNLPESIDSRFLEMVLFCNGSAVFFKDEDLDYETGLSEVSTKRGTYLALPVAMNGTWNVYNVPTQRRAYSSSGYSKDLDENNSVIVYNNMIHTNAVLNCKLYAKRLYDLDCTIDVNARAQKTPVLIKCPETQRLTLLNLYKEFDGNAPVIFGDSNLDLDSIKSISTEAPFVADKLYQLKTQIWNEALTYLGIANVNYQKKERLISDEVDREQGGTIASRFSRLQARQSAVEKINAMFRLNIEVDYRQEFKDSEIDELEGEGNDE